MTQAQIQKLYPGNQLARIAASALADDRKADRRAVIPPLAGAALSMPEQRTLFEQGFMASQCRKAPYLVGHDMTYVVRGALNDSGDWVYHYHHTQMAWEVYCICLRAHGIEVQ